MKKVIRCAVWLLLLIMLVGCGKKTIPVRQELDLNAFQTEWGFYYPSIQSAEEGWYFFREMTSGIYVYYYDRKTEQVIPVCNRAECSHDDMECNANLPDSVFPGSGMYMTDQGLCFRNFYHNEKKNILEEGLICVHADGSGWETLPAIYQHASDESRNTKIRSCCIDHSMIYYVLVMEESEKCMRTGVFSRSVDGTFQTEYIGLEEDDTYEYVSYSSLMVWDKKLYFMRWAVQERGEKEILESGLYCYDPEKKQTVLVKEERITGYVILEDVLYYCQSEQGGIFAVDLKTGKEKAFELSNEAKALCYPGDILYLAGDNFYLDHYQQRREKKMDWKLIQQVPVMNQQGELIDVLNLPGEEGEVRFCGGNALAVMATEGIGRGEKIWMFDCGQLGNKKKNWIEWE